MCYLLYYCIVYLLYYCIISRSDEIVAVVMASVTDVGDGNVLDDVVDNINDVSVFNDEPSNISQSGDSYEVIFSELLLYSQFYIHRSSVDSICKTICEYYSNTEVIESKKLIWATYGLHLPKIKWRRCLDANEKNVKDIIDSLLKLDSLSIVPVFAAKQLDRLPKHEPDELKLISVIEKLRNIEAKLGLVEEGVSLCRNDIDGHDERLVRIETVPTKSYSAAATSATAAQICAQSAATRASSEPATLVKQPELTTARVPPKSAPNAAPPSTINEILVDTFSGPPVANDEFEIPSHQARRLRRTNNKLNNATNNNITRAKAFFGKSTNSKIKGVPLPGRDFFISRLSSDTNIADLKDFLCDECIIDVRDIVLISHPDSKFKSFKVTVCVDDINKLLKEELWPAGAKVQRFYNRTTNINKSNT